MTVDPSNEDPVVLDDRVNTSEGEAVVVDVLVNDLPDAGLVVTEVSTPENGRCAVTDDGRVQYTPDEGFFGQDECTCEWQETIQRCLIVVSSSHDALSSRILSKILRASREQRRAPAGRS